MISRSLVLVEAPSSEHLGRQLLGRKGGQRGQGDRDERKNHKNQPQQSSPPASARMSHLLLMAPISSFASRFTAGVSGFNLLANSWCDQIGQRHPSCASPC